MVFVSSCGIGIEWVEEIVVAGILMAYLYMQS